MRDILGGSGTIFRGQPSEFPTSRLGRLSGRNRLCRVGMRRLGGELWGREESAC